MKYSDYYSLKIRLQCMAEQPHAISHTVLGSACYKAAEAIDSLLRRPDLSNLPDHARLQVEAILKQYGGGE